MKPRSCLMAALLAFLGVLTLIVGALLLDAPVQTRYLPGHGQVQLDGVTYGTEHRRPAKKRWEHFLSSSALGVSPTPVRQADRRASLPSDVRTERAGSWSARRPAQSQG